MFLSLLENGYLQTEKYKLIIQPELKKITDIIKHFEGSS